MSKLPVSLFVATLGLAVAAVFADAQTAPKPKPPASAEKPASPAATTASCPDCPRKMEAADKPSGGSGADKPGMMHGGGMMMHQSMHGERHARHQELAALADIKVQTTKYGATIQLVAKKQTDAAKVQELAKDLTAFLSEPHGHPHGGPKH